MNRLWRSHGKTGERGQEEVEGQIVCKESKKMYQRVKQEGFIRLHLIEITERQRSKQKAQASL